MGKLAAAKGALGLRSFGFSLRRIRVALLGCSAASVVVAALLLRARTIGSLA